MIFLYEVTKGPNVGKLIESRAMDTKHKGARPEQQLVHSEEDDGVREDEMFYCNNMSVTGYQQAVV